MSRQRVALIGAGTVGAAIASQLRTHHAYDVVAYDRNPTERSLLQRSGLATFNDPAHAVAGAHVVMLVGPHRERDTDLFEIMHTVPRNALVVDVAPLWGNAHQLADAFARYRADVDVVLASPMLGGSPARGTAATSAPLDGIPWLIGVPGDDPDALQGAAAVAAAIGGEPLIGELTAREHDFVRAVVGHSAQLLAVVGAAGLDEGSPRPLDRAIFTRALRLAEVPAAGWSDLLRETQRPIALTLRAARRHLETLQFAIGRTVELAECAAAVRRVRTSIGQRSPSAEFAHSVDRQVAIAQRYCELLGYALLRAADDLVGTDLPSGVPAMTLADTGFVDTTAFACSGIDQLMRASQTRDYDTIQQYSDALTLVTRDVRHAERLMAALVRETTPTMHVFGLDGLHASAGEPSPSLALWFARAHAAADRAQTRGVALTRALH